jgi:SAM-dependent methyltransferase
MNSFTEEYYQSENYKNYLDRQERYRKTAKEIVELLSTIGMIKNKSTILDYGCAVGFLSKALLELGFDPDSFDISEWATEQARNKGCRCVAQPADQYNVGFFLDVLEHMTIEDINTLLTKTTFDYMVVRIPVSESDNPTQFHLAISRKDPTHINCATADEWIDRFRGWGYHRCYRLNLKTIYDSPGCFCALIVK